MKALRPLLFLLLAAVLAVGCATPKAVIEGDSPQALAGNAIAQAEVALIKGYRLVADQAKAGVLFKSELEPVLDKLDQAAKLIDDAKVLYDKGVFDGALDKILGADKALDFVEAEIAKKLKERRQPVAMPAPMSEAEAKEECVVDILEFLVSYQAVREEWSEEAIVAEIKGHPKMQARAKAFVHADMMGDRPAAQKAMDALYQTCISIRMNPEVQT